MIVGFQIESCPHLHHFLGHLFCRTSEGRVSRIGGGGLGKCEDPRAVDVCIMRVGGWWSIEHAM
jgi:hypothetical protein